MDIFEIIKQRHSVRQYEDRKIEPGRTILHWLERKLPIWMKSAGIMENSWFCLLSPLA